MSGFDKEVSSRRKALGLTQEELGEALGVSRGTVSNWETRTSVPNEKHLRALRKIDRTAQRPGDEIANAEGPETVDLLGETRDFDPTEAMRSNWPEVAGIYVLKDIKDRPIYVGQSENIAKRLAQHKDKFWYKSPIVHLGTYVRVEDRMLRQRMERILIKLLEPVTTINKL